MRNPLRNVATRITQFVRGFRRRLRVPRLQTIYAVVLPGILVAFIAALNLANQHGTERVETQRDTQESSTRQIDELTDRVAGLEDQRRQLTGESEKAKAQAGASVEQLVRSGQDPILVAPEILPPGVDVIPDTTIPPETSPPRPPPPPETTTTTTTTTTVPPPPPPEPEPEPEPEPPPETTTTTTTTIPPPEETTTTTTTTLLP